ncbi:hypothetical protein [Gordonibacter sp.]|uniref:hypothetical protein n=1 Tax=Gordonibacter sp. TaxID=1968902 RepID=UPI002FCC61E2
MAEMKRFVQNDRVVGSLSTCLAYVGISVGASIAVGISVVSWVFFFIPEADAVYLFVSIIINNTFFFIMPGMALCILFSTEFKFAPYTGKKASPPPHGHEEESCIEGRQEPV